MECNYFFPRTIQLYNVFAVQPQLMVNERKWSKQPSCGDGRQRVFRKDYSFPSWGKDPDIDERLRQRYRLWNYISTGGGGGGCAIKQQSVVEWCVSGLLLEYRDSKQEHFFFFG